MCGGDTTGPIDQGEGALRAIDDELAALGLPRLVHLANSGMEYSDAIPVLLKWLQSSDVAPIRSLLINALATPSARPLAAKPLVEAFLESGFKQRFDGYTWRLGNALYFAADASVTDDLIRISDMREFGYDRIRVIEALGKLRDPRIPGVLIGLLSDRTTIQGVLIALAEVCDPATRAPIEALLGDADADVRRLANKAIACLDKAVTAHQSKKAAPSEAEKPSDFAEVSFSGELGDFDLAIASLAKILERQTDRRRILNLKSWTDGLGDEGAYSRDVGFRFGRVDTFVRIVIRMAAGQPTYFVYGPPRLISRFSTALMRVLEKHE